jgi:hypothetical protein
LTGNNTGLIEGCYATGAVSGNLYIGGLIGENRNATVTESYATGAVTGGGLAAGLIGNNHAATVRRCYATGAVSGTGTLGGLLAGNTIGTVTNSFWDIESTGQDTSEGGTGRSPEQMMQQTTYAGWDFTEIWDIDEGVSYPFLRWQVPVEEDEFHSADWHGGPDNRIDLTELLRVIQFYNSGGYHCAEAADPASDEGYLPGPAGDTSCTPHDSDYNPQDWRIDLSELLRIIQFYNSGGYHACEDGEDGFCPGL